MKTKLPLLLFLSLCIYGCTQEYLLQNDVDTMVSMQIEQPDDISSYYYYDELVSYKTDRNKAFVMFEPGVTSATIRQKFNMEPIYLDGSKYNIAVLESESGAFSDKEIDDLKSEPEVSYVSFMSTSNKRSCAVKNEFTAKLSSGNNTHQLEELVNCYGCELSHPEWMDKDEYVVRIPKASKYSTTQLASLFYESGYFESTAPVIVYFNANASSDPLYQCQWYLRNTGQHNYPGIDINIEDAWSITEGVSTIKVAVIDDQIDVNHEDLAANISSGYDVFTANNILVSTQFDCHGTAVAGIIGAVKNNNVGIAGIAPNVKLIPIHVSTYVASLGRSTVLDALHMKEAIKWAANNGADIINISMGSYVYNSDIADAINYATVNGRNGKGCVVVCSSGNDNTSLAFPALMNNVLAVGASSIDGRRKTPSSPDGDYLWGSNYGNNLDVIAPGVFIPTTDVTGNAGYNDYIQLGPNANNNYTMFGGTSAAAPIVSGIAALILSKYPNLTQDKVRRAIELGCVRPSGYSYQTDGRYPESYWNNEVGYGRVNASQALTQARIISQPVSSPGFDFMIVNNSNHSFSNMDVNLSGTINFITTPLISQQSIYLPVGSISGSSNSSSINLNYQGGTQISYVTLTLSGQVSGSYGNFMVIATMDNQSPVYTMAQLSSYNNSVSLSLPNTTVPDMGRRFLSIEIREAY